MLQHPDFNKEFSLTADASDAGCGAVLSQKDDTQLDRPLAFASRTLSPAERNYSTMEKEALAIIWAIAYFRHYL